MLSHYGLFEVLRVEAYVQGTIRLVQIGERRHPIMVGQETGTITLCQPCYQGCTISVPSIQWVPSSGHAGQG